MSKLDELINKLCPDGVKFVPLKDKSLFYFHYGKGNNIPEDTGGSYDVYGANGVVSHIDEYNCEDVTIIGHIGAVGFINRCKGKCFVTYNGTIAEVVNKKAVNTQFLYYVLTTLNLPSYKKGSQPFLSVSDFENIKIPAPPMEVQCEIVRILDNFTELTAELTARKKQYEYYRDNLILNSGYPRVKLSDISTDCFRGAGIKRDEVTEEGTPCVRYGEIYTSYGIFFDKCISHTDSSKIQCKKVLKKNDILFAITGESVEDIAKSTAYIGEKEGLVGGDIVVLRHNQNAKYLSYALSTADAVMQKGLGKVKSKVVHSNAPSILAIEIPLPSLEEQQRIVDILDNFDNLTMNMSTGIPSEIDGRTKQYEYYRDKLLEFKELKA